MEIIKNTIKVGNSAGVLLPKKWLNSQVKIILEPLNIEKEVIEIIIDEGILKDVLGLYLVGSYARKEQTIDSDVDILAITSNTNKTVKRGRYEIICISEKEVGSQLIKNVLPLLPMIKEAKPIINGGLIKHYTNSPLNSKNLRFHIETTKSAMKVVEKDIELSKEMGEEASDASAYSLILRLRTLYIISCLRDNKIWNKKDFLKLIKDISGSLSAYERYLSSKNKNTRDCKLPIKEAEKLMDYVNKKIIEFEKWTEKEKKD
jgi:predicted nucleotidyltransferase